MEPPVSLLIRVAWGALGEIGAFGLRGAARVCAPAWPLASHMVPVAGVSTESNSRRTSAPAELMFGRRDFRFPGRSYCDSSTYYFRFPI